MNNNKNNFGIGMKHEEDSSSYQQNDIGIDTLYEI